MGGVLSVITASKSMTAIEKSLRQQPIHSGQPNTFLDNEILSELNREACSVAFERSVLRVFYHLIFA
jgi:hypothetical protein